MNEALFRVLKVMTSNATAIIYNRAQVERYARHFLHLFYWNHLRTSEIHILNSYIEIRNREVLIDSVTFAIQLDVAQLPCSFRYSQLQRRHAIHGIFYVNTAVIKEQRTIFIMINIPRIEEGEYVRCLLGTPPFKCHQETKLLQFVFSTLYEVNSMPQFVWGTYS